MALSTQTKVLHSIIALSMISLLAIGIYMEETKSFGLYPWHKSFGVLVLIFAIYRIYVRIKEGWPQPIADTPVIQLIVAKLVHWGLIISTVLYPISGMMMSGAGGKGIAVFGIELMARNIDPVTNKTAPVNEMIASIGHNIHGTLVWIVIVTIVLHAAGAIKHHVIDKDDTLRRMFSFKS